MLRMVAYYWKVSRGHRLRPWKSPYLRWRMETFFGPEAEPPTPWRFLRLLWRERRRLREFILWTEEYRRT
jgi:hypothetical protein